MKVLYSNEMRKLDQRIILENRIPGLVLMENAAEGLYKACLEYGEKDSKYVIICGTGNNGGDGFALARKFLTEGIDAKVFLLGSKANLKGDAKTNAGYFLKSKLLTSINTTLDIDIAIMKLSHDDVIVDAIFGTGLSREVTGLHKDTIEKINQSKARKISVDIPSGINADTGQVLGVAVRADFTLTFQYPKPGHFLYPGRDYKGRLRVKKIGIDEGISLYREVKINAFSRNSKDLGLKKREANTHKGTYGSLVLICASKGMTGAGTMAAGAALKGGVGLLNLCVPECVYSIFQKSTAQAITQVMPSDEVSFSERAPDALDDVMKGMDALAVGPGISTRSAILPLVRKALCTYDVPKVFDADALTMISKDTSMIGDKRGDVVFTPHPKEFSRLYGIPVAEVLEDPIRHAVSYAKSNGVNLLLKGATTVIASPYGDVSLILTGTPGMAKGGSGDVLTGLIGAFMAQGHSGYDSAILGAYIAGLAGEIAELDIGEYSMTPVDTINKIARAVSTLK